MVNARAKRRTFIIQGCLVTMREKHHKEYLAIVRDAYMVIPERGRAANRWENWLRHRKDRAREETKA